MTQKKSKILVIDDQNPQSNDEGLKRLSKDNCEITGFYNVREAIGYLENLKSDEAYPDTLILDTCESGEYLNTEWGANNVILLLNWFKQHAPRVRTY